MKVLHTLDNSNRGGIQELILQLFRYSVHEHEFVAADGSMAADIRAAGMKLWDTYVTGVLDYDVVVGHTVGGWDGSGSSIFARRFGAKFVECMHSVAASPTKPEDCDGFIALSDLALQKNSHFPKATRIYGVLDASRFGVHVPDQGKIGRLSRLAGEKGVLDFVMLARTFPQLRFVCAGDGPLMGEMQARKPDNLELPGWVSDQPNFMSTLGLFVFSTRDECCCMSVAQAQAAGVPVICSDIPPLRETTGGHAVFAKDVVGMAGEIQRYLDDVHVRMEYSQRAILARSWAISQFDKSVTVPAWDAYLESL